MNFRILYLACHNSLRKVHGSGRIIHRKELFAKLGRQYLVCKSLRESALKEFEEMGLLKRIDRDKIEIQDLKFNIEEEPNKIIEICHL